MKLYKTRNSEDRLNLKYSKKRSALRIGCRGNAHYIGFSALEFFVVMLISAVVFFVACAIGDLGRGYTARGGELLVILLPAIYYLGKRIIGDMLKDFVAIAKRWDAE